MMVIWDDNLLMRYIMFLHTRYILREDEQARGTSSGTFLLECFRKQTLLLLIPLFSLVLQSFQLSLLIP